MHAVRKGDHLRICMERDVRPEGPGTGLDRYRFVHQALPEVDLGQISTGVELLGKQLRAPILVSAMTGGTPGARTINRRLAQAAQACGVAMGVGSQRTAIESPELADTFRVRDVAPDILLLANLGVVQLGLNYGVEHCLRAVEMIGADALVLHLNPLQEALQPEGDTAFAGLQEEIGQVCEALPVPVVVKEVGCGLSAQAARKLADVGVSALDVAGFRRDGLERGGATPHPGPPSRARGSTVCGLGDPHCRELAPGAAGRARPASDREWRAANRYRHRQVPGLGRDRGRFCLAPSAPFSGLCASRGG